MSDARAAEDFLTKHPDLEALDAFVIDVNGNARGKRVPIADLPAICAAGLQFSACSLIFDARGTGRGPAGLGVADGDPDGTAVVLPGTLALVPWAKRPTAQVQLEMRDAGTREPLWWDPRRVLTQVIERCRADGIHPVVACELEFYLLESRRTSAGALVPAGRRCAGSAAPVPSNLSLDVLEDYSDVLSGIGTAALTQNVPASTVVAEYGAGQFEINLRHTSDPLQAADHAALLRRAVRGVAQQQGYDATFMPKPFPDQPGSGLHVHVSLVDEVGRNRFGSAGGDRLLGQAIAGMQTMTLEALALFAPHSNAHRRFSSPSTPRNLAWSENNRSAAFRVPVSGPEARRIEHRIAGADASPHLVVAAVLAAIHHGISCALEPTPPANGEWRQPAPEFAAGLLPALARLERSELLARYIPERYLRAYVELKRGEFADLAERLLAAEMDYYL